MVVFFFLLCNTFEVRLRSRCDFLPNTVVSLGNISVSTWIWIYLTHSTLAGSRPRWCIYLEHISCSSNDMCGHNWILSDTVGAMFTSLTSATCYTPFQLQGKSSNPSRITRSSQQMWRIKGQRIAAYKYYFIMTRFFCCRITLLAVMCLTFLSKVHRITMHIVLTVSDAVPSKCVSELADCSTKSIFCLSLTVFLY